jgi:hypothetical protein
MISTNKYTKYDYLFRNVVPNPHLKIKIFGENDSYLKPQDYDNVTNLENKILCRKVVLTRYNGSEMQERYYVIDSMKDMYRAFQDNHNLFWFEGKTPLL